MEVLKTNVLRKREEGHEHVYSGLRTIPEKKKTKRNWNKD